MTSTRPHLAPPAQAPLANFIGYFLWLGTIGFGGPIALVGHMQRSLVDERAWITKEDYLEGLALAQLAPGPLAAQLAIYLGYIRAGIFGATAVGMAFYEVVAFLLGQFEATLTYAVRVALLAALYNAVLTPILYPLLRRIVEGSRPRRVVRF